MGKEDAVRKSLLPISGDLSICSNSEYFYAIFAIAVVLRREQGGREIAQSESLSTIGAILTHCLDTTATNNYFVRTQGQWFCLATMLKGTAPVGPQDDFPEYPEGPNPRLAADAAPKAFYRASFALVLSTFRVGNMSWLAADGRLNLSASYNLPIVISRQAFRTVYFLSAFVKPGGLQAIGAIGGLLISI